MDSRDVEATLVREDARSHQLKAKAFDWRAQKLTEDIKKAKSESEVERLSTLREQSIEKLKKYRQTY